MSQIIFLTKSLDIKCIEEGFVNTSSAAYEYGLVGALNGKADLLIIYLGMNNMKVKIINNINYCSINYKSFFGFYWLAKIIYKNRNSNHLNIVTTGYYPIEMVILIIFSKIFKCKSFSYVYDTHLPATAKMPLMKRLFANIYFDFGFYLVKKTSALLILNESFIKRELINTPYLKTKIGTNLRLKKKELCDAKTENVLDKSRPIIVFAGTINSENGVNLLIDFINSNKNIQCELHFYGSGEGASLVEALEMVDARVKYFGRISEELLHEKLVAADFLINLRNPVGPSIDYSFPSKLINFMSTGTPVISNRFPGLDDCYISHLYLIEHFNVQSISEKIVFLLSNDLDKNFGVAAKDFVGKENDWNDIAEKVVEFLNNTRRIVYRS